MSQSPCMHVSKQFFFYTNSLRWVIASGLLYLVISCSMFLLLNRWFQSNIKKQFVKRKNKSLSVHPYIIISMFAYKMLVLANMHAYFYRASIVLYISFDFFSLNIKLEAFVHDAALS